MVYLGRTSVCLFSLRDLLDNCFKIHHPLKRALLSYYVNNYTQF
jgi:hypothetical protein